MQCSACGNELMNGARFCPVCGAVVQHVQGYAPAGGQPVPMYYSRVARHLQALGGLWLAYAVWRLLTKLAGLLFVHSFLSHRHVFAWGPWTDFGSAWMPFAFVSIAISVALCTITAYALITRQPWGRVFAIVCGVLALFHPLMGTALGIYTLWVLAPRISGLEYAALTVPARIQ
jgi:ABC-type spermidine/putrescine transport system permease subunit II